MTYMFGFSVFLALSVNVYANTDISVIVSGLYVGVVLKHHQLMSPSLQ